MGILRRLEEYCYDIATLGKIGYWPFGGIIASLFAFPVIIIGKLLHGFNITFFNWVTLLSIIFVFFIVWLASRFISEEFSQNIVIDKIVGLVVTFIYVPFYFKIAVFGFIIFNVINFSRRALNYRSLYRRTENLPFGLGIILGDVVSGIISNLIIHLVIWIAV
ncbi:phosphatidylglycerophosphatase A [Candidatus Babeliales bacterium]|nr:phosphatidylglycerophosphatase A [Candidatus Babeliales bacterium]MCF7899400.1 phosphatidylglycerophosphatase A [Candidatus Babeliales bacterium]